MAELMKCGHTATGHSVLKDGTKKPCCVSCSGLVAGADEVADEQPSLDNRKAKCSYGCGAETASSLALPFFAYHPNSETDSYYCGCYGWD